MIIALCYSMQFAARAEEAKRWYAERGYDARPSASNAQYLGLTDAETEALKLVNKYERDAIREHWKVIQGSDAVLVLNYDKNGIPNYVGGNAFLEMGFAHVLNKPIFLLNPIPKMPHYETELVAMRPTVIDGDFARVLARA